MSIQHLFCSPRRPTFENIKTEDSATYTRIKSPILSTERVELHPFFLFNRLSLVVEAECTVGVICLNGDHVHLIIDDQARMEVRDALELRTFLENNSNQQLPLITSIGKNFSMGLTAKEEFLSLPNISNCAIVADSKAKRFLTKMVFDDEIRDSSIHVFSSLLVARSWCKEQ